MTIRRIIDALMRRWDKYVLIPLARRRFNDINILSSEDSIHYIIEHRCSLSRFGDGEFFIMMGKAMGFQQPDARLTARLKDVILNENDNENDNVNLNENENETLRYENYIKHLVAIPLPLKDTSRLRPSSKEFWGYFVLRYGSTIRPLLSPDRQYLDTQLTRFYMQYDDKSGAQHQLSMLKQIWEGQDIVIVEGCQSRTGVGNDLYANARSIQRILGPATNAFDKYQEMLDAITRSVSKDKLVLLCYGMTATVLAYDLARHGYWAIDLGHLDIEYEWLKLGTNEKVSVKGKYTNESKDGDVVDECKDEQYLSQIICDITK